ncbi:MAG: tRNA (N(6)-L-threonylcarbamoyladenosine(37)-C(2))-methylthiotransferase MtaB [Deltaproteobacteria bacterium]|nr:tRNA (N(6)-L-threonylcarbamoyladenosine(37)-C(2))-methylthiotransferase MtaB [Deltaproteobacteria bacterium]
MTKVALATLGCKVNQYESAGLIEALKKKGFIHVPFNTSADIYIVNTCTVTGKTDYQSRQLIRRAHRINPSASIIATGCYAQVASGDLAVLPGVRAIVGTEHKENIPDMIHTMTDVEQQIIVSDIGSKKKCTGLTVSEFLGHTRAFLKIQDGCDAFCSYCIIPYARGRSRSLPEEEVMKQIETLSGSGYREIVLTGIHLGNYGHDLSQQTSLLNLLEKIEQSQAVERLRLSSIEPMEVTDELIDYMKASQTICRHIHIPLQCGDDAVLQLMNRNYTADRFRERIETIMDAIPEIAIGIDVMVGFPGEGEREFNNTRTFIERLPVAYLHVFPYSQRPGTAALTLQGQVRESLKKERGKLLRDIGKKKRMDYNAKFIGKELSVLVEDTKDRETGLMKGFSDNYIPVLISNGNRSMANHIVTIVADNTEGGKIRGHKIETSE